MTLALTMTTKATMWYKSHGPKPTDDQLDQAEMAAGCSITVIYDCGGSPPPTAALVGKGWGFAVLELDEPRPDGIEFSVIDGDVRVMPEAWWETPPFGLPEQEQMDKIMAMRAEWFDRRIPA